MAVGDYQHSHCSDIEELAASSLSTENYLDYCYYFDIPTHAAFVPTVGGNYQHSHYSGIVEPAASLSTAVGNDLDDEYCYYFDIPAHAASVPKAVDYRQHSYQNGSYQPDTTATPEAPSFIRLFVEPSVSQRSW